ncbi:co-chaperone DjlA [Gallaecimonas sp. GXIMD4217]|uniref:co-chaperone DjlA n=1 Tax=Gallaecimonas sp. GXIMD4217 TaxID=3131927 RepID=UPI00311B3F70
MNWWGRLLGLLIGLAFARVPGALLGFLAGWWFDKALRRDFQGGGFGRYWHRLDEVGRQQLFFHTTFAVMGHLAKAKGQVVEAEIQAATALMDRLKLSGKAREAAKAAFREGKLAGFPLDAAVLSLREQLGRQRDLQRLFIEIQLQVALADGQLHPAEWDVLERIAKGLGLGSKLLKVLIREAQAGRHFKREPRESRVAKLNDAYQILGLETGAEWTAVRRAYRKAMAEHHPDKLVAKGLPPEMQVLAKERAQAIQAAYQLIKQSQR